MSGSPAVVTFNFRAANCGSSIPCIFGNHPALGGGDHAKAIELTHVSSIYDYSVQITFNEIPEEPVWYSYCFKTSFGSIADETIPKRVLPQVFDKMVIYDNSEVPSSVGDVVVRFRTRYSTQYGQELFVIGNVPELGEWKKENAIQLFFEGVEDYWSCNAIIKRSNEPKTIEYKYFISCGGGNVMYEPQTNHSFTISPVISPSYLEIADTFRSVNPTLDALGRAVFTEVVNRRKNPQRTSIISLQDAAPATVTIHFAVYCPSVRPNQRLVVVGDIPALGQWKPESGLNLLDGEFPIWKGSISLPRSSFPFNYKYVIVGQDVPSDWEVDNNRHCCGVTYKGIDPFFPASVFVNDYYINFNSRQYHGFGVYCPVFSLRTQNSCGIGQYTDIKSLVDLCNKIGSSLIQLLPINDTTDRGEWADSYPYRQVSCFALHPIYVDLLAIYPTLPSAIYNSIMDKKYSLESLKSVDYPAVYAFKMSVLHKLFDLHKEEINQDAKVAAFIEKNKAWLKPYALFCYLRDINNTSDFSQWSEHSQVSAEEVEELCTEHLEDLIFTYWVQYLCDSQYHASVEYAANHSVAIKGDLPIGVFIHSVECWYWPQYFHQDMCAGAPPDQFSDCGQNWGFPTYNWEKMKEDNFSWWRLRLQRMAELYHALRVDHVLGFFRIWEIPRSSSVRGLMGHYSPGLPLSRQELNDNWHLWDIDRYIKPYVTYQILQDKFGNRATEVSRKYFTPCGIRVENDRFDFKPEFDNEKKIVDYFATHEDSNSEHDKVCLMQLICNVLLVPDPFKADYYHPRTEIDLEHLEDNKVTGKLDKYFSSSFTQLPPETQDAFRRLALEFQHRRHNQLWDEQAGPKLALLRESTNMLICAEDLGQLTDSIIHALEKSALLGLRVQRMSKDPSQAFDDYNRYPYLSVCCPGTHDSPSLRGWWESEIKDTIRKFWYDVLLRHEPCPNRLDPWMLEMIVRQHLWSNSMWAIFLLQDITDLDPSLAGRQKPEEEQINIPKDPNHHWCYRYSYQLEEVTRMDSFTSHVRQLAIDSHRI